jgi:hypothetical protein
MYLKSVILVYAIIEKSNNIVIDRGKVLGIRKHLENGVIEKNLVGIRNNINGSRNEFFKWDIVTDCRSTIQFLGIFEKCVFLVGGIVLALKLFDLI